MSNTPSPLPIFISEIGNNSIPNTKVTYTPLNKTYEGSLSQPIKYRLNLPKGLYTYLLKSECAIECNKDIFNKISKDKMHEKDTFKDFDIQILVPYGVSDTYYSELFLYIEGGFYQSISISCPVYNLEEKTLDNWDFGKWNNVNAAKIENQDNRLIIKGLDKTMMDSAVFEYNELIKQKNFYMIDLDYSEVSFGKYGSVGVRLFKDGNNAIAYYINSNGLGLYSVEGKDNKTSSFKDYNIGSIDKIGFVYRGDNKYDFWVLGKGKEIWERVFSCNFSHEDVSFGLFSAKNEDKLYINDLIKVKY